jgi:hypothetical protein
MWRLPSCWRSSTLICLVGVLRDLGLYTVLWPRLCGLLGAPSLFVARDLGWCEYDCPRWGGHTGKHPANPRARSTGFSHKVGALTQPGLRPFMDPFKAEHHRYFTDASPIRPYFQATLLICRCARSSGRYNAHIRGRAVMFPILSGAALRYSFALPRPDALSSPPLRFLRQEHNTRRWRDP